jgi:hypothetical protein
LCLGPAGAHDTPASKLDQLSGFLGDATCTGNLLVTKSPHATSATYHSEKTLGGHWIVVRYDEEASSSNSKPFHVAQYFGYDPKTGQFLDVLGESFDGGYGVGTSSGWHGDVLTFENTDSTSGTQPVSRDVFTRRGGLVVAHTGYERDKNGKWVKTDEEICKRM